MNSERNEQKAQVRRLLTDLDRHAPGELAHADRVAVYSVATGERLGMADEELVALRWAAELHDIGKVRLDAAILLKMGGVSDEEFEQLKRHSELCNEVLESIEFLKDSLASIRHHHERWDGSGYPAGLQGEEIPLGARIIGVAEAFDVMHVPPTWKGRSSEREALDEIRRSAGTQFDPAVVEAFLAVQPLIQPVGT